MNNFVEDSDNEIDELKSLDEMGNLSFSPGIPYKPENSSSHNDYNDTQLNSQNNSKNNSKFLDYDLTPSSLNLLF
jgi:hypothetical protein